MTDISTILSETHDNQNDNSPLKPIKQNEKPNINKEIFFVLNDLNKNLFPKNEKIIIRKKYVKKENSLSKNKTKIIHKNNQILDTTLDFDKLLNILYNQNKEISPKKKKLLSQKRLRKRKDKSGVYNSLSKKIFFLLNYFRKKFKKEK
jgi:hypothetical protein